jgi:phosphonopyruvate decarboxylase
MVNTDIDRRQLLPVLFPKPDDYLFVSGLAGSARDLAALTKDGPNLFALGGVMGAAATIGLGIAMAAPDRNVVVVTGDGELQMNIGSLITIASAAPLNLTIVCIDNERHGETGNQPGHTARKTALELIAKGAGIASAMTVNQAGKLAGAADFIRRQVGPRFLAVKVLDTDPSPYKRLMDPSACRYRFKTAFTAVVRS